MHRRFLQYIRLKGFSQRRISELSKVSVSSVSRFCSGQPISSDKLVKLLRICEDLSLEWLFYGSGDMLLNSGVSQFGLGAFVGAGVVAEDSSFVSDSPGAHVVLTPSIAVNRALAEKDRIIAERDLVISRRDQTILELNRLLLESRR